ncbi:MAG TPA: substrate-binding domain-containing protein [Nitrospiraceae bacterium]|nr:substrate-binding domain-containing protein [Nitrospiraceae bacterium]
MIVRILVLLLALFPLADALPLYAADGGASGPLIIAGNGPEQRLMEKLARAFEKANPRAYVDILWEENSKPIEVVESGQAHIAVSGAEDSDLAATQIGWDGIAVMVNLSNHTKEVTTDQVADIFSGKVKFWSDLGGPETKVLLIDRPKNRNIRDTFERQLGIAGKIPDSAKVIGPDDKAIKTVVGTLPPLSAVTYISLGQALEAVSSGVAVRLLPVDKVEPEEPTVKDGRYKLRRPLLLLTKKESNPTAEAFAAFALSKDGQTIIDNETYTPLAQKP